ncbi:MAG TPA: lytic transglycosylase domain-containing protein [Verrucomicrobiae bacterium]|jgi:soluble lytic murein transglycosylase-like protein|nr:lytic transglycosylase domain-containing protein [Verrucomicrobiae bacterium]
MRSILAAAIAGALVALSGVAADAATVKMPTTPVTISAYATALRHINPQMQFGQSRDLAKHLLNTSSRWRIDPTMLVALVTVESRWHTDARSSVGAIGLGQLMPGTASALHVNPNIPAQNLSGAARYLSGLLARYGSKANRYELTFAAYNAGPHAVTEYGGIPPYSETQNYVVRVLNTWHTLIKSIRFPRARTIARVQPAEIGYWTGN